MARNQANHDDDRGGHSYKGNRMDGFTLHISILAFIHDFRKNAAIEILLLTNRILLKIARCLEKGVLHIGSP